MIILRNQCFWGLSKTLELLINNKSVKFSINKIEMGEIYVIRKFIF
ncbi:hypothetical protein CNEO4_1120018 [Clostridium neonatale]|nr:hypothetical protein CNEO4_1120018 [Clostridium neonatale]